MASLRLKHAQSIKIFLPALTAMIGFVESLRAELPEHVALHVADQVDSQQNGNYGMLERPESISLGQIQEAWNTAEPNAGVYSLNFDPTHVIRLKTRTFTTTSIILPDWEEILDLSLGDNDAFLAEKKTKNIVAIMPRGEGCDTTLTIIGQSGNVYAFYIRAEGVHSKSLPDILVHVQGSCPQKKTLLTKNEKGLSLGKMMNNFHITDADYIKEIPFASENMTLAFEMSAKELESIAIAPQKVYSDGIWTWLDYEHTWDAIMFPAVYRVVDGVDTPVNTRIKDSKIIVHGTPPLTLKSGQKVVCIMPIRE